MAGLSNTRLCDTSAPAKMKEGRNARKGNDMTHTSTRDELVARLVRAGELEISGESQEEVDSYFDTANFAFHGPDGFDSDYAGLTEYFQSIRAAFEDRAIRRGIIIAEGNHIACQTWIEGTFTAPFTHSPVGKARAERSAGRLGPHEHVQVRRPRTARRGDREDRQPKLSPSTRGRSRLTAPDRRCGPFREIRRRSPRSASLMMTSPNAPRTRISADLARRISAPRHRP